MRRHRGLAAILLMGLSLWASGCTRELRCFRSQARSPSGDFVAVSMLEALDWKRVVPSATFYRVAIINTHSWATEYDCEYANERTEVLGWVSDNELIIEQRGYFYNHYYKVCRDADHSSQWRVTRRYLLPGDPSLRVEVAPSGFSGFVLVRTPDIDGLCKIYHGKELSYPWQHPWQLWVTIKLDGCVFADVIGTTRLGGKRWLVVAVDSQKSDEDIPRMWYYAVRQGDEPVALAPQALTHSEARTALSPSGKLIAQQLSCLLSTVRIVEASPGGKITMEIPVPEHTRLGPWSPDGRYVAIFKSDRSTFRDWVGVIDIRDKSLARAPVGGWINYVNWMPRSNTLLVTVTSSKYRSLFIVRVDATTMRTERVKTINWKSRTYARVDE